MNQISAKLAELLLGAGDHAGNLGPLVGQRRHDVTFRHIRPRSQNDRADYLLQVDMMSAMRLVCMHHDAGHKRHTLRVASATPPRLSQRALYADRHQNRTRQLQSQDPGGVVGQELGQERRMIL
jgi:hypothetical protein